MRGRGWSFSRTDSRQPLGRAPTGLAAFPLIRITVVMSSGPPRFMGGRLTVTRPERIRGDKFTGARGCVLFRKRRVRQDSRR